jgi:hypothetical protein
VIAFELNWDAGLGGTPITLLTQVNSNVFEASTDQVIADLTDGANYLFSVRALNDIGWGPYSTSATFMAASVPVKPTTP